MKLLQTKSSLNKKYKWKITFKNKKELTGECESSSLDDIYEIFLKNEFNLLDNGKKGFYCNSDEILYFEVEELLEG